jgi:hypothetical protein
MGPTVRTWLRMKKDRIRKKEFITMAIMKGSLLFRNPASSMV